MKCPNLHGNFMFGNPMPNWVGARIGVVNLGNNFCQPHMIGDKVHNFLC